MPKRRGLKAPIKAQLRSILEDYPGGQLLSEALQNAEDSGSRSFALMLDKRQHGGAVDERLAGPAFVLLDDGSGLGEDELESLENLQDSVKRDSPTRSGDTVWDPAASFTTAISLRWSAAVRTSASIRFTPSSHTGGMRTGGKFP